MIVIRNATKEFDRALAQSSVRFCDLVSATESRMTSWGAVAYKTHPLHHQFSTNGKFELRAGEWLLRRESEPIAVTRMVRIHGTRNDIINTWVFPFCPAQYPVYAAELIAVGPSIKVAFVDIQVPGLNPHRLADVSRVTAPIAHRYAALPCDEAAPHWAIDASQGHYTYSRNATQGDVDAIHHCYLAYLDAHLNLIMGEKPVQKGATVSTSADDALYGYQRHHHQHSPGQKFLSTLFGHDWTFRFMTEFLFAKAEGIE